MEPIELERLERMARNMPVEKIQMKRIEHDEDEIFFAYGSAPSGEIHGIWGYRGIARTMEFKKDTTVEDVRQALVNDAAGTIERWIDKGLINARGA